MGAVRLDLGDLFSLEMPNVILSSFSSKRRTLLSSPVPHLLASPTTGRNRVDQRTGNSAAFTPTWVQFSISRSSPFSVCPAVLTASNQGLHSYLWSKKISSASMDSYKERNPGNSDSSKPLDRMAHVADHNPRKSGKNASFSTFRTSESHSTSSYLQCVRCSAVYLIESYELDDDPRLVRCCTCLHEWYALQDDLLLGDQRAIDAVQLYTKEQSMMAFGTPYLEEATPDNATSGEAAKRPRRDQLGTKVTGRQQSQPNRLNTLPKVTAVHTENNGCRSSFSRDSEPGTDAEAGNRSCCIFIANLSLHATEGDLFRAFNGFGIVQRCQIPVDTSGRSRGYGFVEMATEAEGELAIVALQGACMLGRDISLSKARNQRDGPSISSVPTGRLQQSRAFANTGGDVDGKDISEPTDSRSGMEARGRAQATKRGVLWNSRLTRGPGIRRY